MLLSNEITTGIIKYGGGAFTARGMMKYPYHIYSRQRKDRAVLAVGGMGMSHSPAHVLSWVILSYAR